MGTIKSYLFALWSALMVGLGVFIALKADDTDTETINHIGKIKHNSGDVDITQVQKEQEPKKGLFKGGLKRIFKRKNKKDENNH